MALLVLGIQVRGPLVDLLTYLSNQETLVMELLLGELEGSQGRVGVQILERHWVKHWLNPGLVSVVSIRHVPELGDHILSNVPGPGGVGLPALH